MGGGSWHISNKFAFLFIRQRTALCEQKQSEPFSEDFVFNCIHMNIYVCHNAIMWHLFTSEMVAMMAVWFECSPCSYVIVVLGNNEGDHIFSNNLKYVAVFSLDLAANI